MHGGLWLGMGLFWLLLVGAIIWLVVQLATSGRRGAPPVQRPGGPGPWGGAPYSQERGGQGTSGPGLSGSAAESSFEVLDRRLAAGEIDLDTYQRLRAALLESRGGQP